MLLSQASDKKEFLKNFQNSIDGIKSDKINNIFILGDLNADFNTQNGHKLNQLYQFENLECLVHDPTRITNSTATVLDQIITNSINYDKSNSVTPLISTNDHCTVGLCLNSKVNKESAYI